MDSRGRAAQLRLEMLARALEHGLWVNLFHAQELCAASVDLHALKDTLTAVLPTVTSLRQRIEASAGDDQP